MVISHSSLRSYTSTKLHKYSLTVFPVSSILTCYVIAYAKIIPGCHCAWKFTLYNLALCSEIAWSVLNSWDCIARQNCQESVVCITFVHALINISSYTSYNEVGVFHIIIKRSFELLRGYILLVPFSTSCTLAIQNVIVHSCLSVTSFGATLMSFKSFT